MQNLLQKYIYIIYNIYIKEKSCRNCSNFWLFIYSFYIFYFLFFIKRNRKIRKVATKTTEKKRLLYIYNIYIIEVVGVFEKVLQYFGHFYLKKEKKAMNLKDAIRKRILKFLKIDKLDEKPNSDRLTFIGDEERIKAQKLKEHRVWYYGNSDELLNFYTNQEVYGNAEEPIYNRNKRNYFWGISATETSIKRVHSGVPKTIVDTLTNVIGNPQINMLESEPEVKARLRKILEENEFKKMLNQEQIPLTLVDGWGAYKINFDKSVSDNVILQYYEAENVDFVYKSSRLIAIIYRDYYKVGKNNYVLLETRRIANGDSIIEYELYQLKSDNDVTPVPLNTLEELGSLKSLRIPGYNKILGVACKFFFDPLNKDYGRSIFDGKIDLFDDLDQILSQDSQTVRVSTPVEYYPVDLLERDRTGRPKMPKVYNRQYVQKETILSADGDATNGNIETTQPQLNFEQYSINAREKLGYILTGILSPATLGIDLSKRDNAEAQREKEKITLMTRNNIIETEVNIIREVLNKAMCVQEFLETGAITLKEYEISVKFEEFANPSFENMLQILGPAWLNGEISTELYTRYLHKDRLSEEERTREIAWLDLHKDMDTLGMGDFENYEYANQFGDHLPNEKAINTPIEE